MLQNIVFLSQKLVEKNACSVMWSWKQNAIYILENDVYSISAQMLQD